MRACFTSIARREASVSNRQILLHHPLVCMQGADGLLRGRNQVLVVLLVAVHNLVQLFIKLLQLRRFGHHILQHKLRRLQRYVFPFGQELDTIVDQSLVQEHAPALQKVPAVTDDLDAALGLVAVEAREHVVVRETVAFLDGDAVGRPGADQLVVVFVVGDGD